MADDLILQPQHQQLQHPLNVVLVVNNSRVCLLCALSQIFDNKELSLRKKNALRRLRQAISLDLGVSKLITSAAFADWAFEGFLKALAYDASDAAWADELLSFCNSLYSHTAIQTKWLRALEYEFRTLSWSRGGPVLAFFAELLQSPDLANALHRSISFLGHLCAALGSPLDAVRASVLHVLLRSVQAAGLESCRQLVDRALPALAPLLDQKAFTAASQPLKTTLLELLAVLSQQYSVDVLKLPLLDAVRQGLISREQGMQLAIIRLLAQLCGQAPSFVDTCLKENVAEFLFEAFRGACDVVLLHLLDFLTFFAGKDSFDRHLSYGFEIILDAALHGISSRTTTVQIAALVLLETVLRRPNTCSNPCRFLQIAQRTLAESTEVAAQCLACLATSTFLSWYRPAAAELVLLRQMADIAAGLLRSSTDPVLIEQGLLYACMMFLSSLTRSSAHVSLHRFILQHCDETVVPVTTSHVQSLGHGGTTSAFFSLLSAVLHRAEPTLAVAYATKLGAASFLRLAIESLSMTRSHTTAPASICNFIATMAATLRAIQPEATASMSLALTQLPSNPEQMLCLLADPPSSRETTERQLAIAALFFLADVLQESLVDSATLVDILRRFVAQNDCSRLPGPFLHHVSHLAVVSSMSTVDPSSELRLLNAFSSAWTPVTTPSAAVLRALWRQNLLRAANVRMMSALVEQSGWPSGDGAQRLDDLAKCAAQDSNAAGILQSLLSEAVPSQLLQLLLFVKKCIDARSSEGVSAGTGVLGVYAGVVAELHTMVTSKGRQMSKEQLAVVYDVLGTTVPDTALDSSKASLLAYHVGNHFIRQFRKDREALDTSALSATNLLITILALSVKMRYMSVVKGFVEHDQLRQVVMQAAVETVRAKVSVTESVCGAVWMLLLQLVDAVPSYLNLLQVSDLSAAEHAAAWISLDHSSIKAAMVCSTALVKALSTSFVTRCWRLADKYGAAGSERPQASALGSWRPSCSTCQDFVFIAQNNLSLVDRSEELSEASYTLLRAAQEMGQKPGPSQPWQRFVVETFGATWDKHAPLLPELRCFNMLIDSGPAWRPHVLIPWILKSLVMHTSSLIDLLSGTDADSQATCGTSRHLGRDLLWGLLETIQQYVSSSSLPEDLRPSLERVLLRAKDLPPPAPAPDQPLTQRVGAVVIVPSVMSSHRCSSQLLASDALWKSLEQLGISSI